MNVATNQQAQKLARSQFGQTDVTRRFGYSPGVPNLTMPQVASGLDCNPIKGGELLMFVPGTITVSGLYNPFTQSYTKTRKPVYPGEYATAVRNKFQDKEDFGYRNIECLTALPYSVDERGYIDEALKYFAVVHPEISNCPFGLNAFTAREHGDDVWQHCPTCRLEDLRSPACNDRIEKASVILDRNILRQLQQTLINANEAAIRWLERKVASVNADLEKRTRGENGKSFRNEIDYIYLKMLHQQVTQTNAPISLEQIISANAQAIERGLQAGLSSARPLSTPVTDYESIIAQQKAELEREKAKGAALESQLAIGIKKFEEESALAAIAEELASEPTSDPAIDGIFNRLSETEALIETTANVQEKLGVLKPEHKKPMPKVKVGDTVLVNGKKGKVASRPFGRVKVVFEDGTSENLPQEDFK